MSKETSTLLAELEQIETHACNVARIIAEYRKALLEAGMPLHLADELTVHYHDIWWNNVMNSGDED